MARKEQRRLYSDDGVTFLKWISLEDESRLYLEGRVIPCYLQRRDGEMQEVGVQLKPNFRPSRSTPTTITLAELQANVGITREQAIFPEKIVADAQHKVRAYPHERDTKAPGAIAGARWPVPQIEIAIVP